MSCMMSSRPLQDVFEDVKLLLWKPVEDVFKTCLKDVLKTSSRPTNASWVLTWTFNTISIKLLGSIKSKITTNIENVPYLEFTEVVLMHCDIVNNNCQQLSCGIYTFVPYKSFGQLLDISLKSFILLKYIEVWLTDQNSKSIETEDKINI